MSVAVGSCIQIALFVIPFIVTLGWIIGKPMSMLFDPFESIVLFFSGACILPLMYYTLVSPADVCALARSARGELRRAGR